MILLTSGRSVTVTSGRFFENEPSEICSHLRDKGPKGRLLCAITLVKEKERRKRDSEEEERRKTKEKKNNVCTLTIFIVVTWQMFWPAKRLLSDCFKKFGYIYMYISCKNK